MKTDYWESSSQNNPQRIWAKIYHWKDRWQQSCGHAVIHISYLPTLGGWQIEPETEVINIFTAWYKSSSLLDSQSCLWRFMKLQSANKGCGRGSRRAKALTSVISRGWEAFWDFWKRPSLYLFTDLHFSAWSDFQKNSPRDLHISNKVFWTSGV